MQCQDLGSAHTALQLYQEDALNSLLLEMEFMFFPADGSRQHHSPLGLHFGEVASESAGRQHHPAMEKSPLRMVMAQCLFRELLVEARSSKVIASTPEASQLRQELVRQRLLTEDGMGWQQMQWSAERERLEPTGDPRLDSQKAYTVIRELQTLLQTPGLLLRLHALKPCRKCKTGRMPQYCRGR